MKLLKIAACGVLLTAFNIAQANQVIDLFSGSQVVDTNSDTGGVGSFSSVAGPATDIIGGNRDLEVTQSIGGGTTGIAVSALVSGGIFTFSQDTNAGGTAIIQWDGADATAALDTTPGLVPTANFAGLTGFNLDVIESDGGFFFSIGLYTSALQSSVVTIAAAAIAVPTPFSIPLAAFNNCASPIVTCVGGGVNLASIAAIEARINLTSATEVDLGLDAIRVVPAPATLALFGAGLLGFAGFSRKRRA